MNGIRTISAQLDENKRGLTMKFHHRTRHSNSARQAHVDVTAVTASLFERCFY